MVFSKEKIESLYPGAGELMIEPMLIHSSTKEQLKRACSSGEYFGQLKKDGAFYQFVKNENCYLFGRTVSKKTGLLTEKHDNVPHIVNALECLPDKTVLIGEIYYPGGSSKNVTPIMGSLAGKAIERQNGSYGLIHYYIHDILIYNGYNLLNTGSLVRYNILKEVWKKYNLKKYNFLELAEAWEDNLYERVGSALSVGEEGMVLKKKNGIYQPGKRPDSNLKAKKVDFIDAIIIGFEEPTKEYYGKELDSWGFCINKNGIRMQGTYKELLKMGKEIIPVTKPYYYNWHNARIKIGAYDDKGTIIDIGTIHSGISEELKEDMSKNPKNYLNHVVKIQCMELDSKEKTIRHGFWKGLREDKDAKDCTVSSIF